MTQGALNTVIASQESPSVRQAINVIFAQYGDNVSVDEKKKNLTKFGRNPAATTTTSTVWSYGGTLANEVLISTNGIDSISSSNAGDTQLVTIEGHTISGSDLTFVTQTATLNGQNKVTLTTPLARATRIYNSGSTDFAGTVYVYESDTLTAGVPNTSTKVHLLAPFGYSTNSSLKCQTAISATDYWLIEHVTVAVLKKAAAFVDFSLQVRRSGGVFRTIDTYSASNSSGTISVEYTQFLIVPPNSDVRVICTADAGTTDVMATVHGMLATIV